MIARVFTAFTLACAYASSLEAGLIDKLKCALTVPRAPTPPSIKVLVAKEQPSVQLEVKGKYHLYDPCNMSHISTRFLGKNKPIEAFGGGLKWGEEFPGLHQILIVPDNLSITTCINGQEYQGAVYIYDIEGKLSVVNELDVEEFLRNVMASQAKEGISEEALAALAIVGRTNAYFFSCHPKTPYWAVDAKVVGYNGLSSQVYNEVLESALHSTKYMILSGTNAYEGCIDPVRLKWQTAAAEKTAGTSAIPSSEVLELAKKGENASQILSKAFPNTSLRLGY